MSGQNETCHKKSYEGDSILLDHTERLQELQVVNKVLIETSQIEDTDRICRLTGEAVHKLNKNCYIIILLYDDLINAVRIRELIGFEYLANKIADTPGWNFNDISFNYEDMELESQLFTSGKLEYFKGGLYPLLAKKVPYDLCKKVEYELKIGSILVSGFSSEKKILGSIYILMPEGKKVHNFSAIETMVTHVSKRIHDIRTKKALLETEKKFNVFFQQAPLSYHALDKNGHLIDVNSTWLETLGYSWEETIGKCFEDFLTPNSAEKFKSNMDVFKLEGAINEVEYEAVRKDGKIINITIDGKIAYDESGCLRKIYCVFKDMTAQKEAERKALENEKLLRSMMDSITESVILMKPDRTVAYINETAAKRLNVTQDECIGKKVENKTPDSFLDKRVLDQRIKMFNIVLTEGKPIKFEDVRNGINFLHHIYPVYNSSSQFSYFAVFSMDVTEYRKAEKKLKWELAVNRELAELADALLDPKNSIETIADIVLSAS